MQKRENFTCIETSVSAPCFSKCGDKLEVQNTSLFLKEKGGAGERENFFSRPLGGLRKNSPFASLGLGYIITKNSAFLEKGSGVWGEGKNLFSREKKFFPSSQERIHFNRTARCHRHHCDPCSNIAPGTQLRP